MNLLPWQKIVFLFNSNTQSQLVFIRNFQGRKTFLSTSKDWVGWTLDRCTRSWSQGIFRWYGWTFFSWIIVGWESLYVKSDGFCYSITQDYRLHQRLPENIRVVKYRLESISIFHISTGCFRITVKGKTRRIRPLFHLKWFSQSFLDPILRDILIL